MNSAVYIILIIFGMFLVTYPVRFVPFISCNHVKIPATFKIWLSYVPVAIFAALLTQIFIGTGEIGMAIYKQLPLFVSCVASIFITIKTKHIGWGMGLGFCLYILIVALL